MRMYRKGQVNGAARGNVLAQNAAIAELFGVGVYAGSSDGVV